MKRLTLPFNVKKPILACGADLKGAFAFAKGHDAYLYDGFGDLSDLDNFTRYSRAIEKAMKKLKVNPQIVACDMHPGYFSARFAERYNPCKIQHHEAHIASAITDNNIKGNVLGVAFDGTGFGLDGNIWGGEFFVGNVKGFKRAAHLDYIPMPGGEMCIKEPWRMAASHLYSIFGTDFLKLKMAFVRCIDKKKWAVLKDMIDKQVNSPLTSSMGRLFDTAASIILNKRISEFEAALPIELESIAAKNIADSYSAGNSAKIIRGVVNDMEKKTAPSVISARFHNSVAGMILAVAKKEKIKRVVLSGGAFQNRYLKDRAEALLKKYGFKVYAHSLVETNDSGIPLGQIAIANARYVPPSHSTRVIQDASADVALK